MQSNNIIIKHGKLEVVKKYPKFHFFVEHSCCDKVPDEYKIRKRLLP